MALPMLRAAQAVLGIKGAFHQEVFRWLDRLRVQSNANVTPIGAIVPAKLSASDVSTYFDGTGLGKANNRWAGWAICNGSNDTPNLDGKFPRFEVTASGGTGGSDTNDHTHGLSDNGGATIRANNTGVLRWKVPPGGPSFSWTHQIALGSPTSTGGSDASAGLVGDTDGASSTENRPAYYELVPVMRVA